MSDPISNLERLAQKFRDLEVRIDLEERKCDRISEQRHINKERVESELSSRC